MFLLIMNSLWQSSFLWKMKGGGPLPSNSCISWLSISFPTWIAVCHFSFTTWNNMVRESLTMLQLDNFPADGSIITALPNGVCAWVKKTKKTPKTKMRRIPRFLNSLINQHFWRAFKTGARYCTTVLLGNKTKLEANKAIILNHLLKVNNGLGSS